MMQLLAPSSAPFYDGTSVVRVAPQQDGKIAATYWRFWVEKNEVYATHRAGGHLSKISVHSSGRIHMQLGERNTQDLFPPMIISGGAWLAAFQIWFLLGENADRPPERMLRLKKKKDKALLLQVPRGEVLYLDLLVSASEIYPGPPVELSLAPVIWRTRLQDKRTVLLLARVVPFDEQSSAALRYIRSETQPKFNYVGPPPAELPYFELIHAFWSKQGNILQVVPMGPEGRRYDPEPAISEGPTDKRSIDVQCASATAQLIAPDGSVVGQISITGGTTQVSIVKNLEVLSPIGVVELTINPEALRWGESFTRPPSKIDCELVVGSAKTKEWGYTFQCGFDGTALSVVVAGASTALRNANVGNIIKEIDSQEEIMVRVPATANGMLRLTANESQTAASAELICGFRLRNI